MKHYILKRISMGLLTILVVFTINFILINAAPGDPIKTMMGKDNNDPVLRAALMEKYGLDKPLTTQYFMYLKTIAKGDLGESMIYNRPVADMIKEKIMPTILLVMSAAILSLIVGTSMGIYAARKEGSLIDVIFSGLSYVFSAIPAFWMGLMFIILFATKLNILPSYGMSDVRASHTGLKYVLDVLHHMILPVGTLAMVIVPVYFRIAKTSVLQVTNEDFIMTFRAAGVSEKIIFNRYIFRNAILPTITVFGMSMAYLITGGTLIEIVFAWPGTGRLVLTAITQRDYPTLMGIYMIISVLISVVMFITDMVYAAFDPRIRYE